MYAGPGSGPMLAAAAAWDGLAAEVRSAAASYESVISGLTAGPWLGPASASMAAAAGPYMAWIGTTAAQAEQAATQAKSAAAAYEVAFAATVPPWVIAANRSLLMALIATNIFGQNTPAIATTEAQYAEMWAQDAATMYGYAGQSAAASMLTPFTPAPYTTNPAGLAGQAALVQTSATSAGTGVQTMVSTGPQLLSAVPTALQGLAQPLQSTSGLSGILDSLGFTSPQSYLSLGNLVNPYTGTAASVNLGTGAQRLTVRQERTTHTAPHRPDRSTADQGPKAGAEGAEDEVSSAATASLGQGSVVGGLSVPPGWVMAAPEIRTVAALLPMTSATAAPAVSTGMSGTLFSEMALASMAGRAIGCTVSPGALERIGATTRAYPAPSPRSPGGPMKGITAEICELAEALGKLGVLRDSGILTDEEFNEQKHRLLAR